MVAVDSAHAQCFHGWFSTLAGLKLGGKSPPLVVIALMLALSPTISLRDQPALFAVEEGVPDRHHLPRIAHAEHFDLQSVTGLAGVVPAATMALGQLAER